MKRTIITLAIIALLASCGSRNEYEPYTEIQMNERGKFEVCTYIWHDLNIVATRYNVEWRKNDVTLTQLDSTRKVHKLWADSVIVILKSINIGQ